MRTLLVLAACAIAALVSVPASALETTESRRHIEDGFTLSDKWTAKKQVQYRGKPILIHLLINHERAIVFPEPVVLANDGDSLPSCDILIDGELVGFYPRAVFARRPFIFKGYNTGAVYELQLRASGQGIPDTLEIVW